MASGENVGASSIPGNVVSGRASKAISGAAGRGHQTIAAAEPDEGHACEAQSHDRRAASFGGPHSRHGRRTAREFLEDFFERELHVRGVLSASRRILA